MSVSTSTSNDLGLKLHPKQGLALKSKATEIGYGGAAGGGKSHLLRASAIIWCAEIPGLQVYLFRRQSVDIEKNHVFGPKGFLSLLGPWIAAGWVQYVQGEIRFWNGSKIWLCHCNYERDVYGYQGAEMHVLLLDEGTHFTEDMYRFLRSRVRLAGLKIPEKYAGMFPRILIGTNPGNVGHHWFKRMFVDYAPAYSIKRAAKNEGGMMRQFIPALLDDNPSMAEDDPTYEDRLEGLGSPELVRAMRYGDWDVVAGAFFAEFERYRHVLPRCEIPRHFFRYRSFDWGYAEPFACHWWAVSDGESPLIFKNGQQGWVPKGALICYREWYGMVPERPNVGLRMQNEAVAKGIVQKSGKDKIGFTVTDRRPFQGDGNITIAEVFAKNGCPLREGDTDRVQGWSQMHSRLHGVEWGMKQLPMIYFVESCVDVIRTLPVVQGDPHNLDDVDDRFEDHAIDSVRYACMERPIVRRNPEPEEWRGIGYKATFKEMLRQDRVRRVNQ